LVAAAALALVAGTTGCLAVAAGAGAGAAVAYVRGELETNVNATYDDTVAATNKALQQLGIAKISEKRDALVAVITARNAADKKIEVRLDRVADKLTKVRIRIGLMGDEPLSLTILDKIKSNL
jgi:20S proteasome alpha/beta subunit